MPMSKLQLELFECQNFIWNFWISFRVENITYSCTTYVFGKNQTIVLSSVGMTLLLLVNVIILWQQQQQPHKAP